MADNEKTILITVETDTTQASQGVDDLGNKLGGLNDKIIDKPFKNFKQEMKAAKDELYQLEQQFGRNSKQFAEGAKRVAELQDKFQETNQSIAAFNPDNKLQSLVGAARGATGAIQGISGAMAFLGNESENSMEVIKRLQGLMAFSQALNSVDDIKNAYKNFGSVLQASTVFQKGNAAATTVTSAAMKGLGLAAETSSVGFKILKGAIVATGIGALVIGIVALIQNFDTIKEKILNMIPGLSTVFDFISGVVEKFTDMVGLTDEADRRLDALRKKYADENVDLENRNKLLSAQGGNEDEIYKNNKKRLENDLDVLRKVFREKGKYTDEERKQVKDLQTDLKVLDAQNIKRIDDNNKKEVDKQTQKNKQLLDQQKAYRDAAKKINDEALNDVAKGGLGDKDKELFDLNLRYQAKKDALKKAGIDTKAIAEQNQLEIIAINDKYDKIASDKAVKAEEDKLKAIDEAKKKTIAELANQKAFAEANLAGAERDNVIKDTDSPEVIAEKIANLQQAKLTAEQEAFQLELAQKQGNLGELELLEQQHKDRVLAINKEATDKQLEYDLQKIASARAEQDAKIAFAASIGSVLSQLSALVGKQTVAGKVFALAEIAHGTAVGFIQGLKIAQKSADATGPGAAFAFPIFYASQIAAVLGAAAKAKAVLSSAPSLGTSGGGSFSQSAPNISSIAPTINSVGASTPATQDVRITNFGQQDPIRAYVLASDLQNNEQKNKFLNRISSF